MKISYGKNVYGKEEINAVLNKLKKTTQMGDAVARFEYKIAKLFSKRYGLMVNSGSSALMLATNVLNFKKGDEIIAPCLNFGTAVSSIILSGATPILVDIDVNTLQIDVNKIQKKITKKTKGIIVPNLIGNVPDWRKIKILAKKYKLKIIEDSADTLGAKINNKPTGIYSDISITSFYGSHIISCAGNGGMFLTNDKKTYDRAKVLRSWGRMSTLIKDSENINKRLDIKLNGYEYDKKFIFSEVGYNFEPSEIGASFGLAQLKKLKENIATRQINFARQCNFFSKYSEYFSNPIELSGCNTAWLAFPILIKENAPFTRKQFQIFLEKRNIQTRVVFTGNILRQPMCKNIDKRVMTSGYPNADSIMERGVLLPLHHGLTEKMFFRLHETIDEFIKKHT